MKKSITFDLSNPSERELYGHALVASDYYDILLEMQEALDRGINTGVFEEVQLTQDQHFVLQLVKDAFSSIAMAKGV